jgi:WhiB family redox-sensing transcriptional regulator
MTRPEFTAAYGALTEATIGHFVNSAAQADVDLATLARVGQAAAGLGALGALLDLDSLRSPQLLVPDTTRRKTSSPDRKPSPLQKPRIRRRLTPLAEDPDYISEDTAYETGVALCSQVDPEIFFPEKGGSTRDAKRVCSSCSISVACLDYALERGERYGIWGGTSERERRRLLRQRGVVVEADMAELNDEDEDYDDDEAEFDQESA